MSPESKLPQKRNDVELKWLDRFAKLLDSQFRVPGTDLTFGLDPIIGFLPVVGDVITYLMSALLIFYSAKYGASGKVIMKMLLNSILDFLVAKIPVIGYFFDFAFKANERNIKMLKEHYHEEKHQGTVWPFVLGAFLILLLICGLSIWLFYATIQTIKGWF